MLAFRLIARLDIRNEHLIKTIRCEGVRKVGDPYEYATRYDEAGIDEIVYLDVVASLYGRNSLGDLVRRTSGWGDEGLFTPITVGGGIRSVDQGHELLARQGADKIALNTAAVQRPALLTELAHKFGSQAVTLQLDAKRVNGGWEAYIEGARQRTGKDAVAWAREAVIRGAGEILVTAIDREGTAGGCDLHLIEAVASVVSVPVVASGGVGTTEHIVEVAKTGASGVAMAGVLHYDRLKLNDIRQALREAGIAVRNV